MDATPDNEEWRTIPSLEGYYEASSHGRIRSVTRHVRQVTGQRIARGRVRQAFPLPTTGYLTLRISTNGVRESRYVHRLVCEAFHGAPQDGQQVRHLNGINTDNRPENLRWGTCLENAADRVRHGTTDNGNRSKTKCPQGHLLQAPNLRVTCYERTGCRNCRACEYARTYVRRNPGADFDEQAARYYERFRPELEEQP